jgi:predicted aldo/keto reductase-like oxidoreductase
MGIEHFLVQEVPSDPSGCPMRARTAKFQVAEEVKTKYVNLQFKGSQCTKCGVCVDRCPFEVDILSNMEKTEALLK